MIPCTRCWRDRRRMQRGPLRGKWPASGAWDADNRYRAVETHWSARGVALPFGRTEETRLTVRLVLMVRLWSRSP